MFGGVVMISRSNDMADHISYRSQERADNMAVGALVVTRRAKNSIEALQPEGARIVLKLFNEKRQR